jgi:hypothetical protein
MNTAKILWIIVILILALSMPFAIREFRHKNDLRLCSSQGSYNVYFDRKLLIYDDGIYADQVWPIESCSNNTEDCFISKISFKKRDKNSNKNRIKFNNSLIEYNKIGKLKSIVDLSEKNKILYKSCKFPLFR